jgi:hypothetical protein
MGQLLERKFQLSLTFTIHVTEDAIQPKTLLDEESAALPKQNRRLLLALINEGGNGPGADHQVYARSSSGPVCSGRLGKGLARAGSLARETAAPCDQHVISSVTAK